MKVLLLTLGLTCSVFAQEPGHLENESLQSEPKQKRTSPILIDQFAKSRGLQAYEIQTIHYNRVACGRRIFSALGHSVEGDGDLKAVSVPPDFIEVEFPSHIGFDSFGGENPFGNGITGIDTVTSRQLVNVRDWQEGKPLVLQKRVTLTFEEKEKPSQTVAAIVEVRVKDGTYPSTYIIRETVEGPSRFSLYYICQ